MAFEALVKELATAGIDPKIAEEITKNEKAAQALDDWRQNGLRQSDYDRKFNLSKAEIAAEKARVAEQAVALETERGRMNEQFLAAQQEREKAELALAEARAKIATASRVYSVDLEKEIFGDHTPGPPPKPAVREEKPNGAPQPELSKRLDDIEKMFEAVPNLTVELQDIALQHAQLFPDKPLVLKDIMEKAVAARKSPQFIWDNEFGATAKRQEMERDKYRAEGAKAERERLEQEASRKAAAPFGQPGKYPLLEAAAAKKSMPISDWLNGRASRERESVAKAVVAFQSGKYAAPGSRQQ